MPRRVGEAEAHARSKPTRTQHTSTHFRKLKQLHYLSSYTNRGSFYTLPGIARFDVLSLWSFQDVWFSAHGTLLATAESFVRQSPRGYFADELAATLHTEVQDPLRVLVQRGHLYRSELGGLYLYTSPESATRRQQILARKAAELVPCLADPSILQCSPEELRAAIVLFHGLLDEQQRRLYAGLESLRLGRGGDSRLATVLGLDVHTVARGRHQLLERQALSDRIRQPGAGRKPTKKTSGIMMEIERLLEHDSAGDPISGLTWTPQDDSQDRGPN